MCIPNHLCNRYAYHFTVIDNLSTILRHGLLATNEKLHRRMPHTAIADQNIQKRRARTNVSCPPGGKVHDYVPFYFCTRSPMLWRVLENKWAEQRDIIYIVVHITIIEQVFCVFTDASANTNSPPNFYNKPGDLMKIDWDAVDTWRWASKYDRPGCVPVRQAKQAELLVHKSVSSELFAKIVVRSEHERSQVCQEYWRLGITPPDIEVDSGDFYFSDLDETRAIHRSSDYYIDSDFASLIQTYEEEIEHDLAASSGYR
ncbi:DUF4433 domain-containing protein [Candidatus Chloroploca sp. M-50]|uniref:DUF4433 domain-containing protein n=1 Tax=Candidatus Chloroploca mongolica TaxID=2528176 RepID=A0ABS4DBW3_9CHLR|nr:DUF4433 domain-containing protein [Candidatus Chloroploca mongolica]MBP1466926.1 DUF4433 domain-containing protein [Candidatus Chloroploca mongolica]